MPVTLEKIPGRDDSVILSMGPQHPSTHGVLRLVVELEGEVVVRAIYDIGYLHTGFEKSFESKTYSQGITLTDRMDYLAPLSNNLGYCLAIEKLLALEIPPRAQWIRVLLTELTRIQSHLVWLGTHAIDIGAMSVFLYCFREREEILRIFEAVSGQRMMTSYFRVGGLALEPPLGWMQRVQKFAKTFPARIDEYEALLTKNPIWRHRTEGVGYISAADAIAYGLSGPSLRGSGVDFDIRKRQPYSSYEKFDFKVATRAGMRCVCALPRAGRGNAPVAAHRESGAGRFARRSGESQCSAYRDARTREHEDLHRSADLSLQDRHGGIPSAGGRGLRGHRIAPR